jgi:hypothetical protein
MADTKLKVEIKFQATGDRELARAFKTAAIATEKLKKANEKLNKETKKTRKGFFQINNDGRLLSNTFATIRSKLLLMSFAFTLVTGSVGKFIQKSAQFEKVKVRLNAMFGSVERGTQAFNTFNKIAATTPFQLEDVVEAGAALKAFGADAESLIKPVADLAAFMGTTAAEAASALGRAFAGGAGAADILRERGILQLVRDSQGIEDLSKITLPEFRRALEKTITDPSVGVAGATDKLSKTMSGLFSNLADSFSRLSAAVGDVATGGMFRTGVETMTGLFSTMAEALKEINKTNVDKIEEISKALGIEVKDDTLEKSVAVLQLRKQELKKILDPTTNLTKASSDLTKALEKELELREFLESFGRLTAKRNKEGTTFTKGAARMLVDRAEAERKALEIQVQGFKELDAIQQKLTITNLNLDVANRDAVESFASGLQLLNDISGKEPVDLGLSFRMPEANVQVFTDDLAEKISKIDKAKLDRAFESLLEFETLFQDQLVNGFMNSFDQIISLQKANLDQRINNELKALKKTDKFRNASMEQRQTMEDDIRAKFANQQKRLFKMQQLSQIAQVTMETAKNISALMTSALAASFIDPSAPARAKKISIAMGAISAAQIATIAGQQAPAFARGGSFITGGQQMIMVGDNPGGRERVDITPLSSPDFGDAGGSGSINVNIMGNVIGTQEFVRDNLLPEIENSIKRNLA